MPPTQRFKACRAVVFGALAILNCHISAGQSDQVPPGFSQDSIIGPAALISQAWQAWRLQDRGLEQRIFRLPMTDARTMLQQSLGAYLDYLDARRSYAEAVASYIDRLRNEARPNQPVVTLDAVYLNEIEVMGANMAALQERLAALKENPDWLQIRRAVQAESSRLLSIESARRAEVPLDLSLHRPQTVTPISTVVYRNAEREMIQAQEQLWNRYYQALIDSIEQRQHGGVPLVAARPSVSGKAGPAPAAPAAVAQAPRDPIVGAWSYIEGSEEFNGIAEPREVLLEIRIEDGMIVGRYRAYLPDFSGVRKVDLRLHAAYVPGRPQQTLAFDSKDPVVTGSIILEGPGAGGAELMLVRVVPADSPIPRGRELLRKR